MCGDFNLQVDKSIKAVFSLNVVPNKLSGLVDDIGIVKQEDLDLILAQKVDKVEGKELSTNDFTNELKNKLDTIDESVFATKNYVDEELSKKVNISDVPDLSNLATKDEVPTKTSQLTNDSGFITKEDIGDVDVDVNLPILEEVQQIIDKYAVANLILDSENIKSYPSVVDGYLNASGDINPSSTRGASDYIDLAEYPLGIHIKSGVAGIKDGGYTYACFYDENKKFILNLVGVHGNIGEQDIFSYPQNAKYIRFTLTAKETPLKLMAYYGDKYYDYDIARETDLNVLSEEVSTLNEKLGDFDVNNMPDTTEINKFLSDYAEIVLSETTESYSSIVNAFLNYNGTEVSSSTRGVTDYIDLSLYPVGLHIVSGVSAIQNGAKTYACFYDKDKVFVSNLAHTASTTMDGTDILEYPVNAKYIRFTCTANTTPMVVSGYVMTGDYDIARKKVFDDLVSKKVDNQKNYGKSIGVFGGSLSVRQESQVAKQVWKDTLGVSVTSYGVGGAGFSSLTGTTSIQAQVDGAGVHDIYILWASTNDCTSSKEIGEWTDYTRFDNYDESKLTTQCGGINYCIKKLYEINPNAEIYFFTSLRFFSAEYGYNPYSTSTNSVGRTFAEYVEAQKKCCEYHGIPVLDQFNLQGVNLFNYSLYYNSDKLHMNEDGYRKIGHIQAEFLKNGKGKATPNRVYSVNGQTGAVTIDVPNTSDFATKEDLNSLVQSPTSNYSNPVVYAGSTYNQYVNLESIEVNHNIVSPFTKTIKMTEKGYYHISCVVRVIHTASEEGKPVSFVLQLDGTNYLQETIVLGSGTYTICTLAGTLYIEPNQVVSAMLWQNMNINLTAQLYKLSAVRVYSPFDLDVLTPKVVEDSTSTTATIAKAEANTTYKYGTLTSLTVTEVENSPLPITVIFTTATSSPTINLPATLESINLADGFEAEKKYVLAIENNIAVIGSIE